MNELTIWQNIKQNASKVGRGTTRIFLELYYVLKSPDTPIWDKTIIVSALSYQFLPKQILSREKHGLLGYADNVITLMLAYNRVKKKSYTTDSDAGRSGFKPVVWVYFN